MSESVIIGRISVKVLPDTSDFRRDTKRHLDEVERSLNEVTVSLGIDTRRALRDLDQATARMRRELDDAARIKLEEDRAHNRALISRVDAQIGAILEDRKISFTTSPKVARDLRRIEEKLTQIEELRATITPEMDEVALRRTQRKIDDLKNDVDNIKAQIKPEVSEPFLLRASARLAVLARDRFVNLIPKVSTSAAAATGTALGALSGGRALLNTTRGFKTFLLNLDKAVPKIAAAGLAITALAAGALTSAANLAALSSSLASIGGAALALPGILGGLAIGTTITVVAFKDLKNQVPEMVQAWKSVKKTITENFWEKAQAPIRNMVDSLLPEFTSGFAQASTEIGGYFGSLASNIGSSLQPALKGMFDDLSKSVKVATGGTKGLANIITILGRTGAGYLPRLAKFFVDLSNKFSAFLTRTEASGELKGFIDTAIDALKDLGRVLKNVFSIFNGLNTAAKNAGGSTLSVFADTLGKIAAVVNGPVFQDALTGAFATAFDLIGRIGKQAGPALSNLFVTLTGTFQKIGPLVGDTIGLIAKTFADLFADPAVQSGIVELFRGIASAVRALAPALRGLAPLFGELGKFIGNFAAQLGPVFASFFKAITPALTQLLPALSPIVNILSGVLVDALNAIAPVLPDLAKAFADFLKPIADALPGIVKEILPPFVDLLKKLAPLAAPLGKAFADIFKAATPVLGDILKLIADLLPVIKQALPGIVTGFKILFTIISAIAKVASGIAKAVSFLGDLGPEGAKGSSGALTGFADYIARNDAKFKEFFERLKREAAEAGRGVGSEFNKYVPAVGDAIVTAQSIFKRGLGGMETAARTSGIGNSLKNLVQPDGISASIAGTVGQWLGGLTDMKNGTARRQREIADILSGKAAERAAQKSIRAAAKAFQRETDKMVADARTKVGTIGSILRGAPLGPSIGGAIGNAVEAMSQGAYEIGSIGAGIARDLPGKVGASADQMPGIGSAIMGGLIAGLNSRQGDLEVTLGNITKSIPKHKGPKKVDKVLLKKNGQYIIESLIKGFDSRLDNMRTKLSEITNEIRNRVSKGLRAGLLKKAGALAAKFGPYQTLVTQIENANEELKRKVEEANGYRDGIRDAIIAASDVTQYRNFEGSKKTSYEAIINGLTKARDEAKAFAKSLADLKRLGANKILIDQLAQAGPAEGLASAQAILTKGKAGVDAVNKLQGQIASSAVSAANTAMETMYRAGINGAQGLLAGLKSQKKNLEKEMRGLADALVREFKRKLKIKSPSRVFMGLGGFIGEGLLVGLESSYGSVHKSLDKFGDDLANTELAGPSIGLSAAASRAAQAAYGGLAALPPAQVDQRKFIYNAPPGSEAISSEEQLFAAVGRPRFDQGW